jgi:hypothetical protein
MDKQIIEFIETEPLSVKYESEHTFQFRSDKGWKFIQRLCFWILDRIGAYKWVEEITYKRHTIDTGSFMEKLFRQMDELRGHFNRKPKRLLIGAIDFYQLMGGDPTEFPFEFRSEYSLNNQIYRLTVEIIPWMRGILVMP